MAKPPRVLRRECKDMMRLLTQQTLTFPQPHRDAAYWHLHLPVARDFIGTSQTPFTVRQLCVQTLIDRAHHLSSIAPTDSPTRVVVAVCLPELWRSQILVFFSSEYFDSFFIRDSENQRWTSLEANRSSAHDWHLRVPDDFSQRGYREELREPDFIFDGEIWFIGQLG